MKTVLDFETAFSQTSPADVPQMAPQPLGFTDAVAADELLGGDVWEEPIDVWYFRAPSFPLIQR